MGRELLCSCGCAVLLVRSSGTLLHHIFRLACGVTLSYATLQLSSSLKGHVGHALDHNCLHSAVVYRLAMSVLCKQEGVLDLGVIFNTDCNLREQYYRSHSWAYKFRQSLGDWPSFGKDVNMIRWDSLSGDSVCILHWCGYTCCVCGTLIDQDERFTEAKLITKSLIERNHWSCWCSLIRNRVLWGSMFSGAE